MERNNWASQNSPRVVELRKKKKRDIIKQEFQPLTARWTRGRAIFHKHKLTHCLRYVIFCMCQRGRSTKLTADLTQTLLAAFPIATLWIWYQAIFLSRPFKSHISTLSRLTYKSLYHTWWQTLRLSLGLFIVNHTVSWGTWLKQYSQQCYPKGPWGGGGWLHFGIVTVLINLDRRETEHLDDSKMWNMVGRWGHSECYDQFGKL